MTTNHDLAERQIEAQNNHTKHMLRRHRALGITSECMEQLTTALRIAESERQEGIARELARAIYTLKRMLVVNTALPREDTNSPSTDVIVGEA